MKYKVFIGFLLGGSSLGAFQANLNRLTRAREQAEALVKQEIRENMEVAKGLVQDSWRVTPKTADARILSDFLISHANILEELSKSAPIGQKEQLILSINHLCLRSRDLKN